MHSAHGIDIVFRARRARHGACRMASRCALVALLVAVLFASGASALLAGPPPPIPSSFYGAVTVNGHEVADGTVITALCDGVVYETTETYRSEGTGPSRYRINVPGDDYDTPERDGGSHGETIQFMVGDLLADQTGTWVSGSNEQIDLAASGVWPTIEVTPSPTATATRTVTPNPTATATATPSGYELFLPLVTKA